MLSEFKLLPLQLREMSPIQQKERCLLFLLSLFRFVISQISDIRERHYEKTGIGSSYLFRLDDGYVVSETTLLLFYFIFPFLLVLGGR